MFQKFLEIDIYIYRDLLLSKMPRSFSKCDVTETGRSYFHKMIQLTMKIT